MNSTSLAFNETPNVDRRIGFWNGTSRYGVIHHLSPQGERAAHSTLVVFVHGLFGDCQRTWGEMPEWVLDNAGVDLDVISFDYPAQVWERSSIEQAAYDLKTWLSTEFSGHRHLIFVTHSAGGLIVKHLLREDFRGIQDAIDAGDFDYSSSDALWLRTRHVVNIAVPHQGGAPLLTRLARIGYFFIYPCSPLLRLIRFLTQGRKDWGRNEILNRIRWQHPWLLRLDRECAEHQQACDTQGFSRPIIHDLAAASDLSVPLSEGVGNDPIYFRGTHASVKLPRRPSGPIVRIVADLVRRYQAEMELAIADRTLARIAEVNRLTSVKSLIATRGHPAEEDPEQPAPSVAAGAFGTQSEICDQILASIHRGVEGPKRIVLTGTGGVGKSTVMRRIAWRLACTYLSDPTGSPLPLFVPLQQITVTEVSASTYTWTGLWQWWLNWVETIYGPHGGDSAFLEHKFAQSAVTVMLDGLDDFLANHRAVGLTTIADLLRESTSRYQSNPRLAIVISIRNTIHGLEMLATHPSEVYEILCLSRAQALDLFPACKDWLPAVQDPAAAELTLTPLILSYFRSPSDQKIKASRLTQTAIMGQAIRAFLGRSHLVGVRTRRGDVIDLQHLSVALALLAWLFFYKARGEIEAALVPEEAAGIRRSWERFLQQHRPSRDTILIGFALVEDADTCAFLLQRTVFLPTGPDTYRFVHRSWQEFLLAQYFALCLERTCFEYLGRAKFYSGVYRMAGEILPHTIIDQTMIEHVLATWSKESQRSYLMSNVIGFLAWTRTPVEAQAIQRLLDAVPHLDALSRIILIGGLGYRILLDDPRDPSLTDLRSVFIPTLRAFSDPANAPFDDPVASSLAWCYQKAFTHTSGIQAPTTPRPTLGFEDHDTLKALHTICTFRGERPVLDERSRSLQLALLIPLLDTVNHPRFVIRALHYLYYLVAARRHAVHVFEVSQELPRLLAHGSPFEQIVSAFDSVPELLQLYRSCQAYPPPSHSHPLIGA